MKIKTSQINRELWSLMPNEHPEHYKQSLQTTSKKKSLWRVRCRSTAWAVNETGGKSPSRGFQRVNVSAVLIAVYSESKLPFRTPPFKVYNLVLEKCSHNLCTCCPSWRGTSIQGERTIFWVLNPTFNPHSEKWLKHWYVYVYISHNGNSFHNKKYLT